MAALVCCNGLVNPGTELSNTSIHCGSGGGAHATAPRHDTNQSPDVTLLTDQRTTGIPLKHIKISLNFKFYIQEQNTISVYFSYFAKKFTMQEEAPEAPAQIIISVMLLPQKRLHSSLVSRGRVACWSRAGVSGAGK